MKKFIINNEEVSNKKPPYIIAEISANHNGSIERAKKTILAAKKSGVNAVKIQTYTPDTMTINVKKTDFLIKNGLWKGRRLYDLYKEAYTPYEWHKELFDFARQNEITIFSSPFDETAVDLLESLNTPAYKVASFELVDLPLIKYIAKTNKPILMSTGMANLNEISDAIKVAKENGTGEVALFHCISSYPTPLEKANLNGIVSLKKKFDVQVGLSDHTLGNLASTVATALGASIIEKHFTLNRKEGGVDSSFSMEPNEMLILIKNCKDTFFSLGSSAFCRPKIEKNNKIFRRSLYFVKKLCKGDIITIGDIRRIRPGYGLSPKYFELVIGRKVNSNVSIGDRVSWDILEEK